MKEGARVEEVNNIPPWLKEGSTCHKVAWRYIRRMGEVKGCSGARGNKRS